MITIREFLKIFPPKQVLRFVVVGVVNTLVGLGTYWAVIYIDVSLYQLGNILGFLLGVLCAWYLSRNFVFFAPKSQDKGDPVRTLLRSYLGYGFTTALAALLLYILIELCGIDPYLAPVLTLFITVPCNFLISKFWTFATGTEKSSVVTKAESLSGEQS